MSGHQSFGVANQSLPPLAKCLPYVVPFDTNSSTVELLDLTNIQATGNIDQIQAVFIDNSANTVSFTLRTNVLLQNIVIPPQSQAFVPVLSLKPTVLTFTAGGSSANVPIFLINVPMPLAIWNAVSSGGGGGSGASPVTLSSLSVVSPNPAASFAIAAANPARKYLEISAPASADLWINPVGGTASVGGADCIRIPAGALYESPTQVWDGAINGYTTATAANVTAFEG